MIIECPSCATRFEAAESLFSAGPRRLRCARCKHEWSFAPPGASNRAETARARAAADPASDAEGGMSAGLKALKAAKGRDAAAAWSDLDLAPPQRRFPWIPVAAGATLAAAAALVALREPIIDLWPGARPLYAAAGLAPQAKGLVIRNEAVARETDGDEVVLKISGEVANQSDREMDVPRLRIALRDADARELFAWEVEAGVAKLPPGGAHAFSTRFRGPPSGTEEIFLEFADAAR